MKVRRLKEILKGIKDDDLEVYIIADHGQSLESPIGASIDYVTEEEGEVIVIHEDDLDEYGDKFLAFLIWS